MESMCKHGWFDNNVFLNKRQITLSKACRTGRATKNNGEDTVDGIIIF